MVFHRIGSTEIYSFFFFASIRFPHLLLACRSSPPHFPLLMYFLSFSSLRACAFTHPFLFFFLFTHQYTLFQYERISCTHINIYTQHIYLSELRNLSSFFFFSPP